jgi:hypothetical protein
VALQGQGRQAAAVRPSMQEWRAGPVCLGFCGAERGVNGRSDGGDLREWVRSYSERRYGTPTPAAQEAWQLLLDRSVDAHADSYIPG